MSLYGQERPETPEMKVVSIDTSDYSVWVEWYSSEEPPVYHVYDVEKNVNGTTTLLYTVPKGILKQKITSTIPDIYTSAYSVIAKDTVDNNKSLIDGSGHRMVQLKAEFNPCDASIHLEWTPYQGWGDRLAGYRIFVSIAGKAPEVLDVVRSTDSVYAHAGVQSPQQYVYFLEAVNLNGVTSFSPFDTVHTTAPNQPELLQVDQVNVLDDRQAEVKFSVAATDSLKSFKLVRRENATSRWDSIYGIFDPLENTHYFLDRVLTQLNSFDYQVQVTYNPLDCPDAPPVAVSNIGRNILLQGREEELMAVLEWTPYEGYVSGLEGYTVQRRNGENEFVDVEELGPEATMWQEPIESVVNGFQPGEIQYRVLAVSNPVAMGDRGLSQSNIVRIKLESHIQVPSAFTPGSGDEDAYFKPLFDFAPEEYLMIIFDRGGRKLFETSDPGQGWDGTGANGTTAMEGVYMYHIKYTDYSGLFKTQTGNVTVIYQ